MIFKPSIISSILECVSKERPDWLPEVMAIIKEEHDRFERGDFTAEEQKMFDLSRGLAKSARKTIEKRALEVFMSSKFCDGGLNGRDII